jgi:small subunit ribosomal protein S16
MLKIRLAKTGKKNAPSFRVVVVPKEKSRDGEATEVLGYFNPSTTPPAVSLNKERLNYWTKKGAQMTEAVKDIVAGKYKFKPYVPKRGETVTKEAEESGEVEPKERGKTVPEKGEEENKSAPTDH